MRVAIGREARLTDLLVERARRGDADAFVALIEERQAAMTRLAGAILGNEADAADALQEALVSMWRELPRLRASGKFDAWADRILVNACRLVLRRRARSRLRMLPLGEPRGSTDGPAGALEAQDEFGRAFERLSAEARTILVLHHLEERPVAEIAAVLGIPIGTVKSRLFAARRDLGQALEAERR